MTAINLGDIGAVSLMFEEKPGCGGAENYHE